jgi:hypothetical protein
LNNQEQKQNLKTFEAETELSSCCSPEATVDRASILVMLGMLLETGTGFNVGLTGVERVADTFVSLF